jgi:hypothetical protein
LSLTDTPTPSSTRASPCAHAASKTKHTWSPALQPARRKNDSATGHGCCNFISCNSPLCTSLVVALRAPPRPCSAGLYCLLPRCAPTCWMAAQVGHDLELGLRTPVGNVSLRVSLNVHGTSPQSASLPCLWFAVRFPCAAAPNEAWLWDSFPIYSAPHPV